MSFQSFVLQKGENVLTTTDVGAGLLGWRVGELELLKPVGTADDWTALSSFACGPLWQGRLIDGERITARMRFWILSGKFYGRQHDIDPGSFVNVDGSRSFSNPVIHGYCPNQAWTKVDVDMQPIIAWESRTPESSPVCVASRVEYELMSESAFTCLTSVAYKQRGPYGCCHHPGFRLNPANLPNEEVVIRIPAALRRWAKNEQHGCLLFNCMPLEDLGGLDLPNGTLVQDGWDDGFLLDPNGPRVVELIYAKAGITIKITFSNDVHHVVLCSPPGSGFIYVEPCIGAGNAVNLAAMGLPDEITGHRVIKERETHSWWWSAEVVAA